MELAADELARGIRERGLPEAVVTIALQGGGVLHPPGRDTAESI